MTIATRPTSNHNAMVIGARALSAAPWIFLAPVLELALPLACVPLACVPVDVDVPGWLDVDAGCELCADDGGCVDGDAAVG